MKTSISKLMLLTGILFSGAMIFNSCSKSDSINNAITPAVAGVVKATSGILNRDLIVTMAIDGGTNITADFNSIVFTFTSTSAATGYADARNDLLNVRGIWSMQAGNITMSFPTNILSQLAFMNREWIITENGNNVELRSASGDGDLIQLTGK